jgi:hypothetical protein
MANRTSVRQQRNETKLRRAPSKLASFGEPVGRESRAKVPPANDNLSLDNLPACLPVTDEEVTLLHRYLSREILGLFS